MEQRRYRGGRDNGGLIAAAASVAAKALWKRLRAVQRLTFHAKSQLPTGWNGTGRGEVRVEPVGDAGLLFHERGTYTPDGGKPMAFTNTFRWTAGADVDDRQLVRLEHLRFGADAPVFLFNLIPLTEELWESARPHQCGEDCYAARLRLAGDVVRADWTVSGPRKKEHIAYAYE